MEKIKEFLIPIFLSLVSTFVSGYEFAVSDQEIFIPFIYKINDPTLFKNDLLFTQFTANSSIFYYLAAFLLRVASLETLFFIGFIIAKAFLFVGIYLLGKTIFKNKEIATLSLLPYLIPKFIGGTANLTHDVFFGYRSIGIVFFVFVLLFLLNNKFLKASLAAGAGLFFHPLSILPTLLIVPALITKNSKRKVRDFALFFIVLGSISFLYLKIFSVEPIFWQQSSEWMHIIRGRVDYIFPSLWTVSGWLSLGMYLVVLGIYIFLRKTKHKKDFIVITLVSLLVFTINLIFLDLLAFPGIAKFQLVRSITPMAVIGLAATPALLFFKERFIKLLGILSFTALCLNLFYVFLVSILILVILLIKSRKYSHTSKMVNYLLIHLTVITLALTLNVFFQRKTVNFPLKNNDWIDVQLWSAKNTGKDSKFLVPPNQTGFRIFSKRPIVGDIKDGAVVMYSSLYAQRWNQIMRDLENYDSLNADDIKLLDDKYAFNYVVIRSKQSLNFEEAYSNNTYRVYKK